MTEVNHYPQSPKVLSKSSSRFSCQDFHLSEKKSSEIGPCSQGHEKSFFYSCPMHFLSYLWVLLSSLRMVGAKLAKNCQKIAHDLVRTRGSATVIVFHGQVCRLGCQIVSQQLLLLQSCSLTAEPEQRLRKEIFVPFFVDCGFPIQAFFSVLLTGTNWCSVSIEQDGRF